MLAVQMQGLHMRIRISSYQLFSALRTTYPLILHSFASHNTATSLDLSRIFLPAAAQCVALGTTSRTVCTDRTACSGAPHSYTSGSLSDIFSSTFPPTPQMQSTRYDTRADRRQTFASISVPTKGR